MTDAYDLSMTPPATLSDISRVDAVIHELVERDRQRVEYAIEGAIRAGYDGVDINYHPPMESARIASIVPWNYPDPEAANGYRTERYTWDYFSDEELTTILRAEGLSDLDLDA